jgi:hypothetical protein
MTTLSHSANLLASKYRAPIAMVERLIDEETERITAEARIQTFVPVFVARRVEERLRKRTSSEPPSEGQPAQAAA